MKCILFTGVVVTFFVFGEALKCYHTIGIDRPFNSNDPTITCSEKPEDRCVKTTTVLLTGETLTLRTCVKNITMLSPVFRKILFKFPMNERNVDFSIQDFCGSDNCNGTQSIIAFSSIILVSLFISIFASH